MSTCPHRCPRCGAGLPARVLGGLCPECLIRVSLQPLRLPRPEPAPDLALSAPGRLPDFELLEEIGRGGMGVVWRARQTSLNRLVAVKMIRTESWASAGARRRFRAEAETAATLNHPHIVPIFEVGETAGRAWFAMQLVEGGTLADHLADGLWSARHCPAHRERRLPWPCRPRCCPRGAGLAAKLARAVHYAHQHGVLHGDLKPSNILLDEEGEPHVADFGLARWLDLAGNTSHPDELVGTPSYMAPEQADGRTPITIATDVYSLGAIFYHILTGQPPYLADTPEATLRKACMESPAPLRKLNRDVDRDLEAVCLKCLARPPADRYASAASLADDLDRWHRAENIRARRASPWERLCRWARRRPATFVLTLALHAVALAGVMGVLTQWFRAEHQASARQVAVLEAGRQLVNMHLANGVRSIESGDLLEALPWFAEAARLQPTNELHRLCLARLLAAAPVLEHVWHLEAPVPDAAWSPDGRRFLAGAANGRVLLAELPEATDPRRLAPTATRLGLPVGLRRVAWAPDGLNAAVASADGRVWLLSRSDAGLRELPGPATQPVRDLSFSPDGRLLAAGGEDRCVRLWSLLEGTAPQVLGVQETVTAVAFSPDGALLLATALDGTLTLWRTADRHRLGEPLRASEGLFSAAFSPDGARLVVAGAEGAARLWTTARWQEVPARLMHQSWVTCAAFSPDGRWVATGSEDTTARLWDAADGHPLTPPLRHEGPVTQGAFSHGGGRVATGGEDQAVRLWSVPDGSAVGAPLRHGGAVTKVAWQPGGRLLLTACGDGLVRLWDPEPIPAATPLVEGFIPWNAWFDTESGRFIASGPPGRVRLFHATNGAPASPLLGHPDLVDHATLSPDGTQLLTGCRDTWVRLWEVTSGKESAAAKLTNAVLGVAWHPAGRTVAAFADEPAVHLLDARTGHSQAQLATGDADVFGVAFSPDGATLAAACRDGTVWVWRMAGEVSPPRPTGRTGGATPAEDEVRVPHLIHRLRLHAGLITALAFHPDSSHLLTAGKDGVARLTNLRTGAPQGEPMVHTDAIEEARFDCAGTRVVTASHDGTARVWNAVSGDPMGPPLRPSGGLRRAQFSPDGRFVLTRNPDAIQVWDAGTGTLIVPRFATAKPVAGAGFSADSQRLWVVSEAPRLYTIALTAGESTVDEWQFAARFLSCREVEATGALVAWAPRRPGGGAAPDAEPETRWQRLRLALNPPASASRD